ncbi:cytochrome c oxidase subunit II [Diaphorobacter sp. HDW4B]|uniref:cytochrome c oxidase subunit II n=1 Tax=Diaphorobacter sp. HDW4B TaxID=2714925 RepID=UPI00140B470C|nr:cytochrome c oxidase subunit II [Diaphorobacter sp. HDW4B]
MKSISNKLASMLLVTGAWMGTAAHAVQDLPGGPAVKQLNLAPPVTRIAEEQHFLHWMMLIICTVIFIAVFAVMFYSIWKHRKSKGAKAANFHESVTVEVVWTIVPFIIVILMALPATKVLVAQKDTTNADLTVKATGYQWKWGYDYLSGEGEGLSYISTLDTAQRQMSNSGDVSQAPNDYLFKVDNPLVVPVNKKVRVITTANDVIHAFMVPAFGIKQDAIPGFVRDTWFRAEKVGDYYGQCAELCGKEHAYMPIHVKVLSAEDYSKWVAEEKKKAEAKKDDPSKVWALTDLVTRGEKVYAANCAACHQANGKGAGPIKALDGSPVVLGPTADMMHAVLEGRANGAMPAWKQLSDTDLAAVVTFAKNHWSNKTGTMVQPADFVAARGGKFPAGGGAAAPAAAAPAADAAPAAAAPVAAASANGPFQIFFETGKSELGPEAQAEAKRAADYWGAHKDGKIVLSGFVDSTGSADVNAELAKKRAQAVAKVLTDSGVGADRIELRKPETVTAGAGDDRQARRVDIIAAQ